MGYECPDCGCKAINDADCEECAGTGEGIDGIDGDPCDICDGDGFGAGLMECSECGIIDDECAFEAVEEDE